MHLHKALLDFSEGLLDFSDLQPPAPSPIIQMLVFDPGPLPYSANIFINPKGKSLD